MGTIVDPKTALNEADNFREREAEEGTKTLRDATLRYHSVCPRQHCTYVVPVHELKTPGIQAGVGAYRPRGGQTENN